MDYVFASYLASYVAKTNVQCRKYIYRYIFTDKKTNLINNLNIFIKIIEKKMKKGLRISKYLIE